MTENSLDHFEIGSIILQLEWLKRYYLLGISYEVTWCFPIAESTVV